MAGGSLVGRVDGSWGDWWRGQDGRGSECGCEEERWEARMGMGWLGERDDLHAWCLNFDYRHMFRACKALSRRNICTRKPTMDKSWKRQDGKDWLKTVRKPKAVDVLQVDPRPRMWWGEVARKLSADSDGGGF